MELRGRDRRALRALGNALKPVIFIGKDGVTPAVFAAIDDAHRHEELVKARILDTCPLDRHAAAEAIDAGSASTVVQVLGRTLLLYRPDPEKPRIHLPSHAEPAPPPAPTRGGQERSDSSTDSPSDGDS